MQVSKVFYFCSDYKLFNSNFFSMHTGKVKFFNKAKGFGFIVRDDNGEEIFVHATGLIDEIHQNDSVSFEVKEGKKGLNAINVKVVAA